MFTASVLVAYCQMWLGYNTRYGWGCQGQLITDSIIKTKTAQYPAHYDWARIAELTGLIGKGYLLDCVGLIKGYYWGGVPGTGNIGKYNPVTDVDADSMYYRATVKGPINTIPELPGLCVQMRGHIGVYIGNGYVIESTRHEVFGDGVVRTRLSDRPWQHWLRCPFISYEGGGVVEPWMVEAVQKARQMGILTQDHSPLEVITMATMCAMLINFANALKSGKI